MISYLYERLTKRKLNIRDRVGGNYVDLLDRRRYITEKSIKNARWRINDN